MSLSNAFENDLLLLLFNNTNLANLGDATGVRGSTTAGSLYVGLHTADPGETGNQATSESAYTNYARVGVARSGAGWTVSGPAPTQAANTAVITFPACGVTGSTVTHFSVGRDPSGPGEILWSGALSGSLAVSNGVTPSFAIGTCTCNID